MEENENKEIVETKTPEELQAEEEEMESMTSFGSGQEATERFGDKPSGMPVFKEPFGAFDPPDVPGLDPNDIPEGSRLPLRGADPQTPADMEDDMEDPTTPETKILESKEIPEEDIPPQAKSPVPKAEPTATKEEPAPPTKEMPEESTSTPDGSTEPSSSTEEEETADPIFCPFCGKELFLETIDGQSFYCHHEDQDTACDESFSSIEEIEDITKKKEERKRALQAAKEAQAEKEETKTSEEAMTDKQAEAALEASPAASREVFLLFSNRLDGIVKTLAEIQAKEDKMDTICQDLVALKKEIAEIKESQKELDLPTVTNQLENTANKLSEIEEGLTGNLSSTNDIKETVQKLKRASRDLLLVTDNAGQQFYQFMNSVQTMDKFANRIKYLLPQMDEYLKDLEKCYDNLAKRYSKEQKLFAEHFKKQTESFFKEAAKRFAFKQAGGGGGFNIISLIIPSVVAFVCMLVLQMMK